MNKNYYKALGIAVLVIIAGGGAFALQKMNSSPTYVPPAPPADAKPDETIPGAIKTEDSKYILFDVPFTSQAPTGNWADPRQQDGCEEAGLLMAWSWVNGVTALVPKEAEQAIINMVKFEEQNYGDVPDIDAATVVKLMKDYYHYDKVSVKYDITVEDIKKELLAGHLVLVPANGQKLGNPNYTGEGPVTHNLVIKGFDENKKQFITNDSGTRNGKSYVYSYTTLYNAVVDYPTGYHGSQEGRPKAMIVVTK